MSISDGMDADRGLTVPSGNLSTVAQSALEVDSIDTDDEWDWDARVSSITSSVLDYEYENGRRYHGYRAGVYPLPNDEKELDRLDIQHHVFTLALSGELYLAPLEKPKRVLDIGTGTGLWAIEMADSHPDANVLGVDLSPIQPDLVPSNAHFEIDDIESSWMYRRDYFDFIHSRIMIGAIRNWRKLIKRSFNHLKPGGWLEIQELDPNITSDDGTHMLSPCNREYNVKIVDASEKYGNPVPRHGEWKKMMEDAGFVDVRAHYFKLPINTWPKDPRLKEVGKYQLLNYFEGYEAIGIGLFTRALGWTEPEFQVFLAKIRNELRDRNIHVYQYFTVCYGRKPLNAETVSRQTTPSTDASLANLSINATSRNPGCPVSSIPTSLQYQSPSTPEDVVFGHMPDSQPAQDQSLESSIGSSVPGSTTFRINRSGEVIRLHHGETLQQHPDTYFHFTITNEDECAVSAKKGDLTGVHGDMTIIDNEEQGNKKDTIMSTTTISA